MESRSATPVRCEINVSLKFEMEEKWRQRQRHSRGWHGWRLANSDNHALIGGNQTGTERKPDGAKGERYGVRKEP